MEKNQSKQIPPTRQPVQETAQKPTNASTTEQQSDNQLPKEKVSPRLRISKNRLLATGALVVIILLSITTGLLAYQNWQLRQQISQERTTATIPTELPWKQSIICTDDIRIDKSSWESYHNKKEGITFFYPADWPVKYDSHAFEQGDLVSVGVGSTKTKDGQPYIEGAGFTVAKPSSTTATLEKWVESNFVDSMLRAGEAEPPQNMNLVLGGEKAYGVYVRGAVDSTFLFTKHSDKIFGVKYSLAGEQKPQYEKALCNILSTFKFLGPEQ